jgi:hypothetical protein
MTAWLLGLCICLSTSVFVLRGFYSWQAAAVVPGVAVTSGCEEETMFALWRKVHGQEVYGDSSRLPYASAYFNWFFYAGYGPVIAQVVSRQGDSSIPRTGRGLTAVGALLGGFVLFHLLRKASPGQDLWAGALATTIAFGPLVGWWAFTLRPDVWGMTAETMALALMLCTYRQRPLTSTIASCLLFYLAWSFKQTFVLGLGTALLFLLVRRQWFSFLTLTLGSIALWVATFVALGANYRDAFQLSGYNNAFYFANGLSNLRDMLQKTAPLWLLAGTLLVSRRTPATAAESPFAADTLLLGLLGLCLTVVPAFAASCKLGAYSNYYFSTLTMLALVNGGLAATGDKIKAGLFSFSLVAVMQLMVLLGCVGSLNLTPQTNELAATWAAWHGQPEPRFSSVNAFNLPWLNQGSPPPGAGL